VRAPAHPRCRVACARLSSGSSRSSYVRGMAQAQPRRRPHAADIIAGVGIVDSRQGWFLEIAHSENKIPLTFTNVEFSHSLGPMRSRCPAVGFGGCERKAVIAVAFHSGRTTPISAVPEWLGPLCQEQTFSFGSRPPPIIGTRRNGPTGQTDRVLRCGDASYAPSCAGAANGRCLALTATRATAAGRRRTTPGAVCSAGRAEGPITKASCEKFQLSAHITSVPALRCALTPGDPTTIGSSTVWGERRWNRGSSCCLRGRR
jgi:hypothetical protein